MIETGMVVGFDPQGRPRVRLDRDGTQPACIAPKVRVLTSSAASAGTAHTHTVSVDAVALNDKVAVEQGYRGEWFLLFVY